MPIDGRELLRQGKKMGTLILQLCLFQFPGDAVKAHELMQSAMRSQSAAVERQERESIQRQRQDFEKKFDNLAAAVAEFAKEYNRNKGEVWPTKKAEDLRKAMEAVQQVETRLKADPKSPNSTETRAAR